MPPPRVHDLTIEPRGRQQDAIDAAGNAFALGAARCTLVSPCGTGKTLIALGIAHRRAPHGRALVLCPTRPLLQQTAGSWYARGRPGTYVGLFSDDKPADPALQGLMTMTTDPAVLARAVRTADGPVTVFATYASLPRIIEAHLHLALPRWDIVVVDEAHRTAGALGKQWAAIHDDDAVPARHRLYLTATPRIWDVTRPLSHEPIASMDDQSLYGPVVFRYSLAQAIEEGQLADYRICAPEIHDTQLRTLLAGRPDHDDDPAAGGMRIAGAQLALLRARELHGISRTVVFSRAISHADAFADTLLDTARHAGGRHAQGLCATAVHSRHTPAERRRRMDRFARPPRDLAPGRHATDLEVLCNCRLAIEGVDFPLADSVLFADPKSSTIDIVQGVGRALRLAPGMSKCSTLIIPVFFGPGEHPRDATFGTPYHLLYQVMIALRAHDEHLFHRIARNGREPLEHTPLPAPHPERADEIAAHLGLRTMDPSPDLWLQGLDAAARHHARHGLLDVDSDHIDENGFQLGWWIGYQRSLKAAGNLAPERICALAQLGMSWPHSADSAEHHLALARAWRHRHGHLLPEPTETFRKQPLGAWLEHQRAKHTAGTLPRRYAQALAGIDRHWNPAWPHAWQRMHAAALVRARGGALAIPLTHAQAEADDLTRWLDAQFDAFPALRSGQREQLAGLLPADPLAIGLRNPRSSGEKEFCHLLRAARRFRRTHGHLRVPADHVERVRRDRIPLGAAIAALRDPDHVTRLSRPELDALQALGMEWQPGLTAPSPPIELHSARPTTARSRPRTQPR
ncbi:Helicase associated domain protein [Embleya sp. MST-111070]|uniref:helicase associated domain-containing protein n=1 Tax=Embleya sp. MST-111070 TaxID=3398231 RepID=UPI003F731600